METKKYVLGFVAAMIVGATVVAMTACGAAQQRAEDRLANAGQYFEENGGINCGDSNGRVICTTYGVTVCDGFAGGEEEIVCQTEDETTWCEVLGGGTITCKNTHGYKCGHTPRNVCGSEWYEDVHNVHDVDALVGIDRVTFAAQILERNPGLPPTYQYIARQNGIVVIFTTDELGHENGCAFASYDLTRESRSNSTTHGDCWNSAVAYLWPDGYGVE